MALVHRGKDDGSLEERLRGLSDRFEAEFGETLARWKGEMKAVKGIRQLLPTLWGSEEERATVLRFWHRLRGG